MDLGRDLGSPVGRRTFMHGGLVAGMLALSACVTKTRPPDPSAAPPDPSAGPSAPAPPPTYGPLSPTPDANGLHLPAGFTSRVVGVSEAPVVPSGYVWHTFPDGGATFPTADGGWVYVSNSEVPELLGGVGALRFAADGSIVDAYRILDGTSTNCAGGPTPWGTWLSCEEHDAGHVWECDPMQPGQGVERPLMGTFAHEAAAVDPIGGAVYMTEDEGDSRLYRFLPDAYRDLSAGRLHAAVVDQSGAVTWKDVPADGPDRSPETASFRRGEGMWYDRGVVAFTTTSDNRVWGLDVAQQHLSVIYDGNAMTDPPLTDVDNVTAHTPTGDLFAAEDTGNVEVCVITAPVEFGARGVESFARVATDSESEIASEVTGPAFNPAGDRLYFSSQRTTLGGQPGFGITFEVTGPFRRA